MRDDDRQPVGVDSSKESITVDRFRDGDPVAVAAVTRMVRAIVRSRGYYVAIDDRGEITQQVIVDLWNHLRREPSGLRDLSSFVRTVAHRRCVDWLRRRVSTVPIDEAMRGGTPSPEKTMLTDERTRLAFRVLESLGPGCRDLVRMHAVESRTFREIAEMQGRLEKTVRNQMYKCLERGRGFLETWSKRERLGLDPFGERA